jgi:hypothetical protein
VEFDGIKKRDREWRESIPVPEWKTEFQIIPQVYISKVVDCVQTLLNGLLNSKEHSAWAAVQSNSTVPWKTMTDEFFVRFASSITLIERRQLLLQCTMKPNESITHFIDRFRILAINSGIDKETIRDVLIQALPECSRMVRKSSKLVDRITLWDCALPV